MEFDFSATHTVASFAQLLPGTENLIKRALTYHPDLAARPWYIPVKWNWRLKNAAGQCAYSWQGNILTKLWIDLHPGLAQSDEQAIQQTFLHELAHAMAVQRYGYSGRGHSEAWWEMMFLLGLHPQRQRYHDIAACRQRNKQQVLSLSDLAELD